MNNVAKMVMLSKGKDDMKSYRYEPEDRFTDRRGRPHYDNGRFAPRSEGDMWIEGNYRRDYEQPENRREQKRDYPSYNYETPHMNKIGFSVDGEMERKHEVDHDYKTKVNYPHSDEMRSRSGKTEMGGAHTKGVKPLTRETAEEWVRKLQNEDGTSGAHWNFDQTKQVITQKGLDCDPVEFFVAMNMMYSDYGKVAKKMGVNNLDFYVDMAKAFLDDKDAAEDKLARYYEYVVQA